MCKSNWTWINGCLTVVTLALVAGCTTYNPATGQNEIDYGATAGVAGAAMGAAALGVALSNNDDDRYYYGGPGYYGGRGYGGGRAYHGGDRGHNTVNIDRDINVNNQRANVSNRKVNAAKRTENSARLNKVNRADRPSRPQRQAHANGGRVHRKR